MKTPSPLPAELANAFAVSAARELGVSRDRLRAQDLNAAFRGSRIRSPRAPQGDEYAQRFAELLDRCGAYVPIAPSQFAFSHVTAARLFGMPVPPALEGRTAIDVATPSNTQRRMRGVIGHCLPIRGARVIHGLPVVAPELAWLQLATLVSVDDLVVAGDYLVRRRLPLSTMSLLREQVDAASRARGIVAARLALGDVRSGTDSPPESRTRLVIVRAGLPGPIIGHTVIDESLGREHLHSTSGTSARR